MEPVDMVLGSGSASGTVYAVKQLVWPPKSTQKGDYHEAASREKYIIFISNPSQIMWEQ